MKRYFPFTEWLFNYRKENLNGDLSAGLTVGVMLVPQGMAYSMLAGLPPIYGLYASTIPLILYALMGTSRQLAVGPVAMVALLISAGVGALAPLGSEAFIALTILLALMVGILQLSMGFFKLGFLVNFLSHPVIAGFTSAAAVIIGFSQVKHLIGIDIPRGKVHETIANIAQNFEAINPYTAAIGIAAIVLLVVIKKIDRRIPGPLLAVLFGIGAVYFFALHNRGVLIVADVPAGFDVFALPQIDMASVSALIPVALTIAFIGFMESIAVAKAIQAKHKNYEVNANQELIALGMANIVGSFFKSFPVTGGFSRTAVNDQAGAKTGLASIISASLVIITLLFFTELFYFLPNAILAAIILVAVYGLIDFKEAKHLWKTDKNDFTLFMVTAAGTLIFGVEQGIFIGVVLSLGVVIYRISYPHTAVLGLIPGTDKYRNVNRFSNAVIDETLLIFRFDAQLYFANAPHFRDFIESKLKKQPGTKAVILHAGPISSCDSSALHVLQDLIVSFKERGIDFHIAEAKGPLRDLFVKNDITGLLGKGHFHLNVADAVAAIKNENQNKVDRHAIQTNHKINPLQP